MPKIDHLNFNKYERFFSFGCSMTDYFWPTWADVIGLHIPKYYNFGSPGAGNAFISNQVAEMNQRFHFNNKDLIIVMWTTVNREDRYINRKWQCCGNIYNSIHDGLYDLQYIKNYVDYRGFLIRDLGLISLTFNFLNYIDSDFLMLSHMPIIKKTTNCHSYNSLDDVVLDTSDVLDLYKDLLNEIEPDFLTVQYNSTTWPGVKIKKNDCGRYRYKYDLHPPPIDHVSYLTKIIPNLKVSEKVFNFIQQKDLKIRTFERTNFLYDLNSPEMQWKKMSKSYVSL